MLEIHQDQDFYRDPCSFDAFRFSRPHEIDMATQARAPAEPTGDPATRATDPAGCSISPKPPQTDLVNGGDTFLGFGYGKHSCPGRFFAAHEMKLLLAHLVQHYDVEELPKRPVQQTVMETKLPSNSATIRVRRRAQIG